MIWNFLSCIRNWFHIRAGPFFLILSVIDKYPSIVFLVLFMKVDVATSSTAVQSLIEASSGSIEHGWEVGWSLASYGSGHQSFMDSAQKQVVLL